MDDYMGAARAYVIGAARPFSALKPNPTEWRARKHMLSVQFRDLDRNLIEVSQYL